MAFRDFIFNKAALRRITHIYIPLVAALYLLLWCAVFATNRPAPPPLDLAQSFDGKLPVVYSENYNVEFFGLEQLHPFDTTKYRRIKDSLVSRGVLKPAQIISAAPPPADLMHLAHSDDYLSSLKSSWALARILELHFLRFFPSALTYNVVLEPMLYQMGGSVLAAQAALKFGWAINLGGGFHHASYNNGEGFCPLADISLIIKYLRLQKRAQKFLIVDLDAHQGNGYETDFAGDKDVYILDAYNKDVFPHDETAKRSIRMKVELDAFTGDTLYFQKVAPALDKALSSFTPDLIIYNAGTDLLEGDPLGALGVSAAGVVRRDEMVFRRALAQKTPVVMLLSGGYQKEDAPLIADSLINLNRKFGLFTR